jgi:hypothetical protein
MKNFTRFCALAILILIVGISTLTAQEVTYSTGPAVPIALAGDNGGFSWGDVNGDGILDVLVPQNNVLINQITSFSPLAGTGLPSGGQQPSLAFADFNGDGVPDVLRVLSGTNVPSLWISNAGVSFTQLTATGDLATAGGNSFYFGGCAAADINHSGYLSLAWPGGATLGGSTSPPNGGVWLLKGGASGFTNIGKAAAPGNLAIDTTLAYESWNPQFFDANNDGYQDLLMPSYRNGFSRFRGGTNGARNGSVLFINDGTGKFIVPSAATLGRPIYSISDISAGGIITASAAIDTGIVVDDTVRHFEGLAQICADFDNDGVYDLLFGSNGSNNRDVNGSYVKVIIVYGKGDGTFSYKRKGITITTNGIPDNYARAWCAGDYNNDGLTDILASDGTNGLFRNNGDGTFTNMTATDSIGSMAMRSAAFVDYNNDGFLDIYTYTNVTSILKKNGGNSNHWIGFRPFGSGNNKSALGALFKIYVGSKVQIRTITAIAGAAGMGGSLLANFGLGTATSIDSLAVVWPDGVQQKFIGLKGDRYYFVKEGSVIPPAPTLVSPINHAINQPSAMTFSWNATPGALGYQIQISVDPTFTDRSRLVVNDSALTGTSKAVTGLGLSTVHYWRVLAYNNGFTSAYSVVDTFTTIVQAPVEIPVAVSPVSDAINQPATLTLKVRKTSDAGQYHWQVSLDPEFLTSFVVNDSTVDTTHVVGPLLAGESYFWRVRGVNPGGVTAFGSMVYFTIQPAPPVPVLEFPATNGQNVRADTLVLRWYPASTATGYECEISLDNSFSSLVNAEVQSQGATYTAIGLQNSTKHYWRVRAYNPGGKGEYSAIDSFTTIVQIPAVPVIVSPRSLTGEPRNETFVWRASTYATSYRLLVSTNNSFTPAGTQVDTTVTDTTVTIAKILAASTRHYWKVSAINIGGASAYSSLASFTTGTTVGIGEVAEIPTDFALRQNYPNPFNPSTTIGYDLPKDAYVTVAVYDMLGRMVASLVDGVQTASSYRVEWHPSNLSSGIYFYRMEARNQDGSGTFSAMKKLLFLK